MDLPDCPPGAEGYQDSVTEVPKKPELEDSSCTKAEQEFQEHLNSLRISCEDGNQRCMVERRGRDVSGKWIYLCYPCAAVCSGETILQTHISGKKHKIKIAMRNVWPLSLFDDHPFIQTERGTKTEATEKVLQKMAQEVDMHNKNASEFDKKYGKYRDVTCHIQSIVDNVTAPLLGLEYLVEHPPEQAHYEPSYTCTLCSKQGHPRTIINHMTCFWHRYNYLVRHFAKACSLMTPYRAQPKYREGVAVIMNRLAQRIEDKYGRQRPVHIDKEEYDNDKESIHQWIFKGFHFSETNGPTFEEVVDIDLINTLLKSDNDSKLALRSRDKDPSPPHVAAPSKPHFNAFTRQGRRQERRRSLDALSDISDEPEPRRRGLEPPPRARPEPPHDRDPPRHLPDVTCRPSPVGLKVKIIECIIVNIRGKYDHQRPRYEPYPDKRRTSPYRSRFAIRNPPTEKPRPSDKQRPPNYAYKLKLAEDKRTIAEESAQKTLAYHEKNPEKHPLYPEEWKKFWNRRYKEIQAEGKDPSKHDFKPEWIVFWTARMKELHDAELKVVVNEIYRKLCISPPDMRPRSPELKAKSMERRRSPEARRRSPPKRRSPEPRERARARSPDPRRREPHFEPRRKSPARRVSPDPRHHRRARSPVRTNFTLESVRRSRSPLSRREAELRNRSPAPPAHPHHAAPSMQTVTISDDELKIDENISPWNSDDMDSIGSVPEARSPGTRAGSVASRGSRSRREYRGPLAPAAAPQDLGPPENVVVTLRLLVALEDYLGSLGPKIVDLLTEAIRMEKDKANSSEELLERETAVVLIETAKEKLKGAVQAGLVAAAAAGAVRGAIVRAAATLHVADTRAHKHNKVYLLQGEAEGRRAGGEKLKGAVQAGLVAAAAAGAVRGAIVRAAATLHVADTRAHKHNKAGLVAAAAAGAVRGAIVRAAATLHVADTRAHKHNKAGLVAAAAAGAVRGAIVRAAATLHVADTRAHKHNKAGLVAAAAAGAVRGAIVRAAATLHVADTRAHKHNKEKLKGAVQAGLVAAAAAGAVRGAIVRAAAALHVADTRGSWPPPPRAPCAAPSCAPPPRCTWPTRAPTNTTRYTYCKEKLKGAVQAGLVAAAAAGAVRGAIVRAAATLHVADTRAHKHNKGLKSGSSAAQAGGAGAGAGAGVSVAGVGSVDRAQIAQQMAAALVAQGKTDVSSEELAQLVDAVVGIAEEKKRQEQSKKRMEQKVTVAPPAKTVSGTASALQMLQSAYDENDKKAEKADAPDAMDGLSDSDLETLLKNFNELSAEEQHSLIAYLKKLEAREPQRVERLRQYVSAAASPGAPAAGAAEALGAPADEPPARTETPRAAPERKPAPAPEPAAAVKPVAIDSDDDDYTVEEVFKSVTEKVKEDQIRQEMEIVKKSLEETKPETVASEVVRAPLTDVSKNMSSAANLLALVQASIQSSAAATGSLAPPLGVVASTLQPRSFGDMPIPPVHGEPNKPQMQTVPITTLAAPPAHQLDGYNNLQHHAPFTNHHSSLAVPIHDRPNFGGNNNSHINVWDQRPMHNMPDVRGSMLRAPGYSNYGQNNPYNQQGPRGNFMNGRMQDSYDTRQDGMSQQFERAQYDQNNYGRRGGGGGRGHFGGPGGAKRGRGRGYY
ncbi:uncharacterized protein CG7065-like [Cydia amplana]|uniref:uncharacterized protein CG7065-like n=1 Tax=Cydia amplana TaxID=1869771 RepID=UPI002FE69550